MTRALIALVLALAACNGASTTPALPAATELASDTSHTGQLLAYLRTLRDSSPAEYVNHSAIVVLSVQMHLGRLGFGAGPYTGVADRSTVDAIKRFEAARGLAVTGNVFSRTTLSHIFDEAEQVQKADRMPGPRLPVFAAHQWDNGYVSIEGQWLMTPLPSATEDAVRIECYGERRSCQILYAKIRAGDNMLFADEESYRIASWDAVEIVSRPLDYPCARYVLRINRVQKSVALVRSTLSTTGDCAHMTPADMIMHVATWDDSYARHKREQQASFRLYNSAGAARDLLMRQDSIP